MYGPNISERDIWNNLNAIRKFGLDLKYIQIDDGYQEYMGDWLSQTDKFKTPLKKLCQDITDSGFEPAIWVAPFIAERDSGLFSEHPDWFVKDMNGRPLSSDKCSFGGWRRGPWYMLDGSHPEARAHLTKLFKTLREEWKIKYFKLDANMWGALPFGVRHQKNTTSVQAYKMGMQAILDGAGTDSFILGCNAPMWPSLGLVHGMRITNDNNRSFERFEQLCYECFRRNWQNGVLWVNDPDTVLIKNKISSVMGPDGKKVKTQENVTSDEYMFCAAYVLASGGMILSSDDITSFTEEEADILKKMLPPTSVAAEFNSTLEIGSATLQDGKRRIFIFTTRITRKSTVYVFILTKLFRTSGPVTHCLLRGAVYTMLH